MTDKSNGYVWTNSEGLGWGFGVLSAKIWRVIVDSSKNESLFAQYQARFSLVSFSLWLELLPTSCFLTEKNTDEIA